MNNFLQQLQLVAEHVTGLYKSRSTPKLVYHNLLHTQTVIGRAMEIASNYSLSEQLSFILLSAAWFHDCGHLLGVASGHEERSVDVMKSYMQSVEIESNIVNEIEVCILSTKLDSNPNSLLSAILGDADLYHLGTPDFITTNELVKAELELRGTVVPGNYNSNTLSMLKKHHYFTAYCRELLREGKLKNIAYIEKMLDS